MTKTLLILSGILFSLDAAAPMEWTMECNQIADNGMRVKFSEYCGQYNYNYDGQTINEKRKK